MELTWYGRTCIRIRGRDAVVVADPYQSVVGPTGRGISGDVVTFSHPDDNPLPRAKGRTSRDGKTLLPSSLENAFVLDGPGEYEVKEVLVTGVRTYRDDARGAERGQADRLPDRGRRPPHDPPRRDRPPAVGGEAGRHRFGRHRLRPARRLAVAEPGGGRDGPARSADRGPDADLRRRRRVCRGTQALLPRDGRRGRDPAQGVGHGHEPARPRRPPSCSNRAASRPDPAERLRRSGAGPDVRTRRLVTGPVRLGRA